MKFDKMLTRSQLGGQITDLIEQNRQESSKVNTVKTQENSGNNAKKKTMGAVESQVSIGSGPRNLGSKLENGPVKKEPSQMYAPGLTAAPELDFEP